MSNDKRSDRVLITGGASGIGLATARQLGRSGARVTVFDLNARQVEAARDSLAQDGIDAAAFAGDVRNRTDLARVVDEIVVRWGDWTRWSVPPAFCVSAPSPI